MDKIKKRKKKNKTQKNIDSLVSSQRKKERNMKVDPMNLVSMDLKLMMMKKKKVKNQKLVVNLNKLKMKMMMTHMVMKIRAKNMKMTNLTKMKNTKEDKLMRKILI